MSSTSTSSFPIWIPLISFYCLMPDRTSIMMLDRSGKHGHLCLLLDLRRKTFTFKYEVMGSVDVLYQQ